MAAASKVEVSVIPRVGLRTPPVFSSVKRDLIFLHPLWDSSFNLSGNGSPFSVCLHLIRFSSVFTGVARGQRQCACNAQGTAASATIAYFEKSVDVRG